jgi:DNA modification methylase
MLDEDAAALLDQQGPKSKSRRSVRRKAGSNIGNGKTMKPFKSRRLCVEGYDDEGGPSRFFYCAKASERERCGNPHPTVKPIRLCQYLAKLILPPAGFRKLLVPYCGSGSEIIGALLAGWDYVIGIEREAEYVTIARERLASMTAA